MAELCPERVEAPTPIPHPPPAPVVEPLRPERYTAVIEAAVTEKLERLEARRFGLTRSPRKSIEDTDTSPGSRYMPLPVRRAVHERDPARCGFVDAHGKRCTEHRNLAFHHVDAFACGGGRDPSRVALRCRAHNLFHAEQDFGKDVIRQFRRAPAEATSP
jgi:hypothetical protein